MADFLQLTCAPQLALSTAPLFPLPPPPPAARLVPQSAGLHRTLPAHTPPSSPYAPCALFHLPKHRPPRHPRRPQRPKSPAWTQGQLARRAAVVAALLPSSPGTSTKRKRAAAKKNEIKGEHYFGDEEASSSLLLLGSGVPRGKKACALSCRRSVVLTTVAYSRAERQHTRADRGKTQ